MSAGGPNNLNIAANIAKKQTIRAGTGPVCVGIVVVTDGYGQPRESGVDRLARGWAIWATAQKRCTMEAPTAPWRYEGTSHTPTTQHGKSTKWP